MKKVAITILKSFASGFGVSALLICAAVGTVLADSSISKTFELGETQAQPDLTFGGTSPVVSTKPGQIAILVNVINVGSSSTNESKGNILVDGALTEAFAIPGLAASSSPPTSASQKTFNFTIPAGPGLHTVEIRLDVNNQNRESDEGNNTASRSVTVPASLTVITPQRFGSGKVVGKLPDGTTVMTCAIQPPATCTEPVPPNSTVTLIATPAPDHTFVGWQSGTGSAATCTGTGPCRFVLTANSQISAAFDPPSILTLRASGPGKATFNLATGTLHTVESGFTSATGFLPNSHVSITAIPASGSSFAGWTVVSGSPAGAMCNLNATPCSFIIDKRIFVDAKFSTTPPPASPVTITVIKSGSGTGTVTNNAGMNCGAECSSSVNAGATITLKALPSSNSTFNNWSNGTGSAAVCNNSTSGICSFTLSQNSTITATFVAR